MNLVATFFVWATKKMKYVLDSYALCAHGLGSPSFRLQQKGNVIFISYKASKV